MFFKGYFFKGYFLTTNVFVFVFKNAISLNPKNPKLILISLGFFGGNSIFKYKSEKS